MTSLARLPLFARITIIVAAAIVALVLAAFLVKIVVLSAIIAALALGGIFAVNFVKAFLRIRAERGV
jgi:hypothetical protein